MEHVSVISAFKFAFRTFFKNILFFIGASVITVLAWMAGFIASLLAAVPFMIPLWRAFGKIKSALSGLFAELSATKAAVVQAGTPAAVINVQTLEKFKGVLSKIWASVSNLISQFPHVLFFIVLGVLVFLFVILLVQMMLSLGWCRISLNFKDKGSSEISTLFVRLGLAFKGMVVVALSIFILMMPWFVTYIFFKIHVILGILSVAISIFLTIYFGLKLAYSFYFLADKEVGAFSAIKGSFSLIGGPSRMFFFILLMIPVGIAGGLIVGLIMSVLRLALLGQLFQIFIQFALSTISILGVGYIYRELEKGRQQV